MQKKISNITGESFTKYGQVIEFSENSEAFFEVVVEEHSSPWRIAAFRALNRATTFFENHPDSMESFEPVKGISLLLVAENHCPDMFEVFLLDKPVCLHKGIWHDVIALSDEVLLKITENLTVTSVFHYFEKPIFPGVFQED